MNFDDAQGSLAFAPLCLPCAKGGVFGLRSKAKTEGLSALLGFNPLLNNIIYLCANLIKMLVYIIV